MTKDGGWLDRKAGPLENRRTFYECRSGAAAKQTGYVGEPEGSSGSIQPSPTSIFTPTFTLTFIFIHTMEIPGRRGTRKALCALWCVCPPRLLSALPLRSSSSLLSGAAVCYRPLSRSRLMSDRKRPFEAFLSNRCPSVVVFIIPHNN